MQLPLQYHALNIPLVSSPCQHLFTGLVFSCMSVPHETKGVTMNGSKGSYGRLIAAAQRLIDAAEATGHEEDHVLRDRIAELRVALADTGERKMSYAPQVTTAGDGGKFVGNALRFATEAEARTYLLSLGWTAV